MHKSPRLASAALAALASIAAAGTAGTADAAPTRLAPGESTGLAGDSNDGQVTLPIGETVARRSRTVTVALTASGFGDGPFVFVGFDGLVDLTLGESVVRADDGTLAFVYDLSLSDGDAADEGSLLNLSGFAGAGVVVETTYLPGTVSRSADGDVLTRALEAPGLGTGNVTLVVDTDATEFGANGTLDYQFGEEYIVRPAEPEFPGFPELDDQLGSGGGFASFGNTFSPLVLSNGPAVIPLPAGAWAGLATLGGVGLAGAARRRRAGAAR